MTQTQPEAPSATAGTRAGIIADGVVKLLLGAAYLIAAVPLGDLLGVPTWLMAASGAALLGCGAAEIGCVRRRSARTYLRFLAAYDSGWVLATLVAALIARRGGDAGGDLWIGYQTAAPLAFAALLLTRRS
ncbi:hypothetical protein [Actinomadura flavalba]|uniref:hypothetical protein n=1 Tax=Actinomadura flavalba TaxID=1120938 RepID=UPI00037F2B8B|nr:hypothetical protein [Actinomadura flavalba]